MSIAIAIIRKRIEEAFSKALELGTTGPVKPKLFNGEFNLEPDVLVTKQTSYYESQDAADFEQKASRKKIEGCLTTKQSHIPHYTETNARNFKLRGDTLVGAAMRISSVANSDKPQGNFHRPVTSYWAGDLDKNPLNAEAILLMCEELQAQKDAIRARRKQSFWRLTSEKNQTEKTK